MDIKETTINDEIEMFKSSSNEGVPTILKVNYIPSRKTFKVIVTREDNTGIRTKTSEFLANFEPLFGMDVYDSDIAIQKAEDLVDLLNKEDKEK